MINREENTPYDSKAESNAASVIAALGGRRSTSFTPNLSSHCRDASGEELEGKPDFIIPRPHGPIFIDLKAGALNNHYTRESSRAALTDEYVRLVHRCPDGMSHAELSSALYQIGGRAGYLATLDHAFNHSLWKLVALQAQHGWRSFIVCFEKNPKSTDTERYCTAGLVWCTLKTLPQLLLRIELEPADVSIPFIHRAQKFEYKVEFDNGSATSAEVRSSFVAAIAADKANEAAKKPATADNLAAEIFPF